MYPLDFSLFVIAVEYRISDTSNVPYKIIQTGAKIQAGGCKKGFVKLSYHKELYIVISFNNYINKSIAQFGML